MSDMKKTYKIAGITVAVETPFETEECDSFKPYLTSNEKEDLLYCFKYGTPETCTGKLLFENPFLKTYLQGEEIFRDFYIPYDDSLCTRIVRSKENANVFECTCVPEKAFYFAETWNVFNAVGIESLLIEKKRIILHSSHIRVGDKAILFSAPSGTGKSTQASLWEQYEGAEIINGDRTALAIDNSVVTAYGLPIAGSSNIYKNVTSPLGAVVVIRQAKENSVKRIGAREAFKWLLSETTVSSWIPGFYENVVELLFEIVQSTPVYMLECTPDREAVECLKKVLTEDKICLF